MHIEGEGSAEKLAGAVKKMYDAVKAIRAANPQPKDSFGGTALPEKNSITAAPINEIFGMQGEAKDGMLKFTIGRTAITAPLHEGRESPAAMLQSVQGAGLQCATALGVLCRPKTPQSNETQDQRPRAR